MVGNFLEGGGWGPNPEMLKTRVLDCIIFSPKNEVPFILQDFPLVLQQETLTSNPETRAVASSVGLVSRSFQSCAEGPLKEWQSD